MTHKSALSPILSVLSLLQDDDRMAQEECDEQHLQNYPPKMRANNFFE